MKRAYCLGVLLFLACSPDPKTNVEKTAAAQTVEVVGDILVETIIDSRTHQIVEEYEYYLHAQGGHQVRHGFYRSYHPDGTPLETGHFKFGRKDGEWTYHQGDLRRSGTFADDRLVGVYSYYDSSGRKIREGT